MEPKTEDVKEYDLRTRVSRQLEIAFLSTADDVEWPIVGYLIGTNCRPFVNLVVQKKDRILNVFFLVDTISPNTYVSTTTFKALGLESTSKNTEAVIHGVGTTIHLSTQYDHINILGADFMRGAGVLAVFDYVAKTCSL